MNDDITSAIVAIGGLCITASMICFEMLMCSPIVSTEVKEQAHERWKNKVEKPFNEIHKAVMR